MNMKTTTVNGLSGVILSSPNPGVLAEFYSAKLGISMVLNRHGNTPNHWECDFNGIHFAVLKRPAGTTPNDNIVLSFGVDNIEEFVKEHGIQLAHPIMDLGEGAYIASFNDPDGNTLRLWMHTGKHA